MKILIFIIIVLQTQIFSQVISSVPSFPTEYDSITIFFDATQAQRTELVGYSGTVYTHTGVYTNFDNANWQHVIGNWGDNNVQPALTRISDNLYKLDIGYPRDFYNVTNPAEHITSLNFVFRSADASKQTEDIFLELGNGLKIVQPEDDLIFTNLSDTITVLAIAHSSVDSLQLFIDNVKQFSVANDTLEYNIITTAYGKSTVTIFAYVDSSITASDSFQYVVNLPVVHEALPPGVTEGINYIDDNSVILSLFAPNKQFVYVIGDFNDWQIDTSYYMKRTPNDSTYWIRLNGLTPKQEYAFQYFVDGKIKIADPYTEKVLDPWNDKYITGDIYPNLKPYPEGKTTEIVSVLETGKDQYVWQANDYQRPAKSNLIIYELWIANFLQDHTFSTLIDTLDYLDSLGINAIELMPVTEFEGNESWGYNPSFYFAVDKYYGPAEDLKKFIDECHKRGIAVILDMVLNHSFGQSPFVRLYASGNYGPPTSENPWYNVTPRHPFNVGYDFNHESKQTQKLVDRINKFWLTEYKVDGFRYDLSKGFTQKYTGNDVNVWNQYDQSRIDILKRMADKLWETDSTAYVILEHFAVNSEEKVLSEYGMMLWGNLNYNYNEATMGYNSNGKSDFSDISYLKRGWEHPNLVGYMESHDEERLMYKNLQYGNSTNDYNIKDLNIALNRIKLAAAFFLTVPGPKMIWQFGELGYDYSINYPNNCRLCLKPFRWDYLDDPARLNLYKTFKALTFLKNNYFVFSSPDFSINASGALKTIHISDSSMNVTIIGNFDIIPKLITPYFQNTGQWFDYFSGDTIFVSDSLAGIRLEPGEFHIYTTVKLPEPEKDILSDVERIPSELPVDFELYQNYPNPFNPTTKIKFSIATSSPLAMGRTGEGFVTLKIYDVLGREIATLVNGKQKPGNYEVTFNAKSAAGGLVSGVYYYQLKVGNFIQTKKMILLK